MNYSKLKYRAIIMIDTENVSSNTLDAATTLTEEDLLILPESTSSFKITLSQAKKLLDSKCEIKTIHAENGTPNAMDFVIVSELSYLMGFMQAETYAIISNDKGYTPVATLWQSRGVDIRLVGGIKSLHLNEKKTNEDLSDGINLDELDLKDTESMNAESTDMDSLEDSLRYSDNDKNTEMATKLAECFTRKISDEETVDDQLQTDNSSQIDDQSHTDEQLKIEEANKAIKDTKQHYINKLSAEADNMTESELEDLDHASLSDRDYNKYILDKYIYKFGIIKADEIACLILDSNSFEDIKDELAEIVKRKRETILESIEENWIRFRHNE